jgi:hypothetical protein
VSVLFVQAGHGLLHVSEEVIQVFLGWVFDRLVQALTPFSILCFFGSVA